MLLLQAVNWPVHWKRATLSKVVQSYPMINATVDYHSLAHQHNEMREEVSRNPHKCSITSCAGPYFLRVCIHRGLPGYKIAVLLVLSLVGAPLPYSLANTFLLGPRA